MIALLVRLLCRLLFRVQVRGRFEPGGKMLIVANHQSFIDGVLLGAFLPVKPTYLVHSSIARKRRFRIGLRFIPHLVVDSANPLAMKSVVELVESGTPVVIFPEGRITSTGGLMKVYEGPAFVAAKSGARVLPVHIHGPLYSWFSRMSGDFPKKLFPKFTITYLPARAIAMPEGRTGRIRRRLASEALRRIMQEAQFLSRRRTTIFEAFLDSIALHGRGRRMMEDIREKEESYHQILRASLALGRIVSKLAAEDEHVGVLMPNVGTTVSLLLGMFATRRVPAMLNYTSGLDGMQNACRIARVRLVLSSRAFIERAGLGAVVEKLRDVRVVYLEDLRPAFGLSDKLWLIGWALWFPRTAIRRSRPEDPAIVLFTSGSEGKPKGVVLSHDSILANIAQLQAVIEFSSKDKFMSALPMFHSFGITAGFLAPMICGGRVFIYPSPLHYRVIPEIIYDRDCTILFATGTFLGNYARFAHPYDFYRIKYAVSGAEKLSEEVRRIYIDKFGLRILEGYGATECSPVISVSTPLSNQPGSVGELLPGMEYRLAPVAGMEGAGILHVKGPNVMLGYYRDDRPGVIQPPSSEFGEGWYETGDVVTIDETRAITIRGRLKRFAKVAGEMVSLESAERIASAVSPKFGHGAVAWHEVRRGELIALFTEDPNLQRERLQDKARELGMPEIAVPRKVIFLEKLPLLGNGKKDYVTLGGMVEEFVRG